MHKKRRKKTTGSLYKTKKTCIFIQLSLLATQMLLFAGCHRAVLFRGRTNRKPSLSSSLLPNSFEHWLRRLVSVSTTGINFTTANPLDQIRWDAQTENTHAVFGEDSEEQSDDIFWGLFFTLIWKNLSGKTLFETF